MSIKKLIKNFRSWCPQPQIPLTTRLKRHSLPIAAAVTATLVLSVTFSIFYLGLASYASPPPIINDSDFWSSIRSGSFYESAYAKATSEQKEELDKILADKDGFGIWIRPVLIAIGDLPKDQPRLSAEQAAELYDSKEISALEGEAANRALVSEFNKIAGAPDFYGGSGVERAIYYLNDDRSEVIVLYFPGDVSHVVYNDDGTETRVPLGNQKLPVNPGPSIAPKGTPTTLPVQPTPTKAPSIND
ncbi:MAG: hypothetical protein ACQCN6_07225 [Candidatus Bathyarchaeia archaeon]|jgi:hypothetical protein